MNIDKYTRFFFKQLATASMLLALLISIISPVTVMAVDLQKLPFDTAAATGYTHVAKITWDDLNASDNSCTTIQLCPIPTNGFITKVAFYVSDSFTNTTAANTNLLLCLGVGGSTNYFTTTNQIDGSTTQGAKSIQCLATNMLVPYKATTSTNYMIATFSADGSTVDDYIKGKIQIYWKLEDLSRIRP